MLWRMDGASTITTFVANGDYHGLMPVSGRFSMKHAHNQGPQMVMIGTALSMASMVLAMGVAVAGGTMAVMVTFFIAVMMAMAASCWLCFSDLAALRRFDFVRRRSWLVVPSVPLFLVPFRCAIVRFVVHCRPLQEESAVGEIL